MEKERTMSDLKVRVFKGTEDRPATTVTVPGGILKIASRLIPGVAAAALKEQGIDLDELVRLSEAPDAKGRLVEIEDHRKNERIVISLE
jgi:F0F1-type ATP synthase epsilon subunit